MSLAFRCLAGPKVGPSSIQHASSRRSIVSLSGIKEINTDDTPGVASLLSRDFKEIELNEDAFAATSEVDVVEEVEKEIGEAQQQKKSPSAFENEARRRRAENGPTRSKDAIAAGLDLFKSSAFAEAAEMFQLALELPGSGVYRLDGSPKEFSCPSDGEENAALYNLACAYAKLGKIEAALTCLEGLNSSFEEWDAMKSDPDLAPLRGPALDKLLASRAGLLSKLFGQKKDDGPGEKPWILW